MEGQIGKKANYKKSSGNVTKSYVKKADKEKIKELAKKKKELEEEAKIQARQHKPRHRRKQLCKTKWRLILQ